jgi:hypothetical protein
MALSMVSGLSAGTGTPAKGPALWISSVHADSIPNFLATPSGVDFGAIFVSTVFTETVTVSNSGTSALFISSVTVDTGEFTVSPASATVAGGGSFDFYVTFSPTFTGDQAGNLVFVHNGVSLTDLLPLIGTGTPFTGVADETPLPKKFALQGNYPNPFNPTTRIVFDLPKATTVSLTIYNALGAEVAEVLDQAVFEPGTHEVSFNGANLASGIYFYRMRTPEFNSVKKMVLLK